MTLFWWGVGGRPIELVGSFPRARKRILSRFARRFSNPTKKSTASSRDRMRAGMRCSVHGVTRFRQLILGVPESIPFPSSFSLRPLLRQLDVSHPEAVDGPHQRLELAQLHWLAQIAIRLKLITLYDIRFEV